jgi:hypothetical protein
MGILERVVSAENSSDLEHHEERECDVDVLGAVGMAGIKNPGHLAIYRLKYLRDKASAKEALDQFKGFLAEGPKKTKGGATGFASKALDHWVNDKCDACKGLKFIVEKAAPCLTDRACKKCAGTGLRKISGDKAVVNAIKDAIEKADDAVNGIRRLINKKFRG